MVSRYAPVPDVAKQAGMVWNADTNQLAVMVQKVTGDPGLRGNLTAATPTWPSAMQGWQSQATPLAATALTGAGQGLTGAGSSLLGTMLGTATERQQGPVRLHQTGDRQCRNHGAATSDQGGERQAKQAASSAATISAATTAQQQAPGR